MREAKGIMLMAGVRRDGVIQGFMNGLAKLGHIRKWQVKRQHYVSSSPAETSLLAIRMIWLLSSLTLMILA